MDESDNPYDYAEWNTEDLAETMIYYRNRCRQLEAEIASLVAAQSDS